LLRWISSSALIGRSIWKVVGKQLHISNPKKMRIRFKVSSKDIIYAPSKVEIKFRYCYVVS